VKPAAPPPERTLSTRSVRPSGDVSRAAVDCVAERPGPDWCAHCFEVTLLNQAFEPVDV
jgi:hypothetical protein